MLAKARPLKPLRRLTFILCAALSLAACTSDTAEAPEPESATTTTEAEVVVDRETTLRIGIVVNELAPTATFDAEIETILREAMTVLDTADSVRIELTTVSVETVGQAEGSMLALIQDGVSVVITGCDDATVPAVVQAATSNELLAVTGCVALPRPDIERLEGNIDPLLFIDLSSLADNALAIDQYGIDQGYESLGVLRSTLLPDVEQTCVDLDAEITRREGVEDASGTDAGVAVETVFAELIDAPTNVVADFEVAVAQTAGGTVDAIVVCALPPSVGDLTQALREAGFDQPIIVPWYGDAQSWSEDTANVVTLTPASRHGNDPETRTTELFDALAVGDELPSAVDVVTADTLAILVDAVLASDSVGSRRLAETIRSSGSAVAGVSGPLETGDSITFPLRRVYRVIEIENGEASFSASASALEGAPDDEG